MKTWFVVDDCTTSAAAVFEEKLKAATRAEAEAEARAIWESLSEHDKRRRDEFFAGYAEETEDGCPDYDTMTEEIRIK